MNDDEYSHYHSYQDQKDAFYAKVDELAARIYNDLWLDEGSILEAIKESLSESEYFADLVIYCEEVNNPQLLGMIALEIIDKYLSEQADELAEDQLT